MLNTHMMQEIIDLKLQGYTPAGIRDYYEAQGIKPPSMPTIRKYFEMDILPDNLGEKLEKPKVFDVEPFRSEIIKVLENNRDNSKLCISSVYDFLEEHGTVVAAVEGGRVYDTVFDTAPGKQMLIDFGEIGISRGLRVHFICLLLRYSRYLVVYAQDHKYNVAKPMNQEDYNKQYDKYTRRYNKASEKYEELHQKLKLDLKAKAKGVKQFIDQLATADEFQTEFDEILWTGIIDHVTVNADETLDFTFINGQTIKEEL